MKLLRRDFVPVDTRCAKPGCPRRLSSGSAWIIEIDGVERPYGPTCGPAVMGKDEFRAQRRMAPDLTTHDMSRDEEADARGGVGGGTGGSLDKEERRLEDATSYLTLRGHVLPAIPGMHAGINALTGLYESYRASRQLTAVQVERVLRIESGAKANAYVFSLKNLRDVYAAYHQLQRQLYELAQGLAKMEREPWRDRGAHDRRVKWLNDRISLVDGIRRHLLKKLYLTFAQVKAAKLQLRPDAFPIDRCQWTRASTGETESGSLI